MFSNLLRSQARLGLLTAARTVAVPASRSLSSLILRPAIAAPVVSRVAAARAFSSGTVLAYEGQRITSPPSETLYVGNMPWDMTQDDLMELFSEFGTVVNARVQAGADGRPRGFAHVTFASVGDATSAMTSAAEEPIHVAGRDLVIDYARSKKPNNGEAQPNKKLYFARFNSGETALRDLLSEFKNDVVSIYFIRDGNTGEKLNAGFIEFGDIETATDVLNKLNGAEIEDGFFSLSYARPRRADDKYGERNGDKRYPGRRDQNNRSRGYQSRGNY